MELGSEQRDLQLVQNVWKELERGKHESSTNIFTLYSKVRFVIHLNTVENEFLP